ncbi:CheC domain protein [Desulfobulbus propionicus DSM 2032]|jgi:chemotaxis protein CheX|uniref:CheC domain protein n=1 Tax=Desulfobulbus propionicus (strain ATCC 33891 / DSM 2032 / VKM B-1956 / 1pr3) TaxID=577650 RepID=A0A7U3YMY6_DESPD|nr:CheC domain protein [Desulfobulbus propionicus DSM 2032]
MERFFLELEKYLIDATLEVFASMIFIDIEPEASTDAPVSVLDPNLSSLIGLAGDLKGILAIHCPEHVALGITTSMLGMEVTELGEDVKDAIGEIANMVAGGLKVALAANDRKIELAIPTTVIGKSIRTTGLTGATRIMIPFSSPIGRFGVELRFVLA